MLDKNLVKDWVIFQKTRARKRNRKFPNVIFVDDADGIQREVSVVIDDEKIEITEIKTCFRVVRIIRFNELNGFTPENDKISLNFPNNLPAYVLTFATEEGHAEAIRLISNKMVNFPNVKFMDGADGIQKEVDVLINKEKVEIREVTLGHVLRFKTVAWSDLDGFTPEPGRIIRLNFPDNLPAWFLTFETTEKYREAVKLLRILRNEEDVQMDTPPSSGSSSDD